MMILGLLIAGTSAQAAVPPSSPVNATAALAAAIGAMGGDAVPRSLTSISRIEDKKH